MPITHKPAASIPAFSSHGKVSFIKVVPRSGEQFTNPATLSVTNGTISDTYNPPLYFDATVVAKKTNANLAVLKLTANNKNALVSTGGVTVDAVTPTDGLLSITLVDAATDVQVVDFPVTYIDDPGA